MFEGLKSKFRFNNKALSDLVSYSFWSVAGSMISKFMLLVIWIFLARILGDEGYGTFSAIRSTTFLFSEFVALSLTIAATKYVAQYLGRDNLKTEKLIGTLLVIGVVSGVVMACMLFFGADYIAMYFMKAPQLGTLLKTTSAVLLVSMINNCQQGILRGLGAFKVIAKINLLQIVFSFPVYIVATYLYGIPGAVAGYVFYNVVVCFITQYYIHKTCRSHSLKVHFGATRAELKSVLFFMMPYFFSVFISMLGSWYNEMRLFSMGSYGSAQMGYYSACTVIQTTLLTLINIICIPYVSVLMKYSGGEHGKMLERLNLYVPIYMCVFFSVPFLLVPELLSLAYGVQYSNPDVYAIAVVISMNSVFMVYRQALGRLVAVYEKQIFYLCDTVIMTAVMVAGFYYYRYLGAFGLVCVTLVANVLSGALFTPIYVKARMIDWSLFKDRLLWIYMLVGLVSFVTYWFTEGLLWMRIAVMVIFLAVMAYGLYKNIVTAKRNGGIKA